MKGKGPLHPDPRGDLPHGEGLGHTAVFARDHQTFKDLDPFFLALFEPHVHFEVIPGTKVRDIGEHLDEGSGLCYHRR